MESEIVKKTITDLYLDVLLNMKAQWLKQVGSDMKTGYNVDYSLTKLIEEMQDVRDEVRDG